MPKKISIVIPVYNEAENIRPCYEALQGLAKAAAAYDFEFIFTDNASRDETPFLIEQICAQDPRVKYLRYSANVGYQKSIYVGLCVATGDAAAELDCDLEDPPMLIRDFIAKWEEGYEVVYGIRVGRVEPYLKTFLRKLFYRMMARISPTELPVDAGDFRLIGRRTMDILRQVPEREPYLRGLIASLGFKQIGIPYARQPRTKGSSKFNFFGNLDLAMQGIVGYSKAPMRLAVYAGFVISLMSILFILLYLVCRIEGWITQPGFTTIIITILISWSTVLLFLGLIGEYIAAILVETRQRPRAIIERSCNLELDRHVF